MAAQDLTLPGGPTVRPRWLADDRCRLTIDIDAQAPWFEGHFPDRPVLPGITLVHWAGLLAADLWPGEREFGGLPQLKFSRPVLPGDELELELTDRGDAVDFTYFRDHQPCASGRLGLTAEAA